MRRIAKCCARRTIAPREIGEAENLSLGWAGDFFVPVFCVSCVAQRFLKNLHEWIVIMRRVAARSAAAAGSVDLDRPFVIFKPRFDAICDGKCFISVFIQNFVIFADGKISLDKRRHFSRCGRFAFGQFIHQRRLLHGIIALAFLILCGLCHFRELFCDVCHLLRQIGYLSCDFARCFSALFERIQRQFYFFRFFKHIIAIRQADILQYRFDLIRRFLPGFAIQLCFIVELADFRFNSRYQFSATLDFFELFINLFDLHV